jgi:hypothetical protein
LVRSQWRDVPPSIPQQDDASMTRHRHPDSHHRESKHRPAEPNRKAEKSEAAPTTMQSTQSKPRDAATAHPIAGSWEARIHDRSPEVLRAVAIDPQLTEELALGLLTRRDLTEPVLVGLSKNGVVMKHRKVLIALVRHPRTPRHVSLPIARRLYTFELMQIALTPGVAADLKMVAEEAIISRLESVSAGERMALARRASTRVAAALLHDPERRIIEAALQNPYLTEAVIVKAIMDDDAPEHCIAAVYRHQKWSVRREIRVALLRNPITPLTEAVAIARSLPAPVLREILQNARLTDTLREELEQQIEKRSSNL